MAKRETHEIVRTNLERIRRSRGWTLQTLSDRMTGEVQLSVSGLSKIETGARGVDVDDLVAIAAALDVSPLALLLPSQVSPFELVHVGGTALEARVLWEWAIGQSPITDLDSRGFQARSLPWWFRVASDVPMGDLADSTRARLSEEGLRVYLIDPEEPDDG